MTATPTGRWWPRLILASLVPACLACAPAAVASITKTTCRTPVGTTVTANSLVRVFRIRGADIAHTYACYGRTHRPLALGDELDPEEGTTVRRVALAGRYVAAAVQSSNNDAPLSWAVLLYDVRGRTLTAVNGGLLTASNFTAKDRGITGLVVSAKGSAAWIVAPPAASGASAAVMVATPNTVHGQATVVAEVPTIDLASLATDGRRVYWTEAGQPHVEALP
jgi:hypothetical protein